MKRRIRPILLASAIVAGGASLFAEPVFLRDLSTGDGPLRMSVGAVRAPLWSAAFAQGAGDFTLENVVFGYKGKTLRANRVEFSGVPLPRQEVERLLAPDASEPLSARLSKISARRITIPEVVSEYTLGPVSHLSTYRNIVLTDVVDGRAKLVVTESAALAQASPKENLKATYGRMAAEDTDFPAMARAYSEGAGSGPSTMTVVQRAFTAENMEMVSDQGMSMKIARASGRDFAMKPGLRSINEISDAVAALAEKTELDPDEGRGLMLAALDVFDLIGIGSVEISGIEFRLPIPDAKNASTADARVARIAYSVSASDRRPDLRVEGFSVATPDGEAKIDLITFSGFNFDNTFATLRSLRDKPTAEWTNLDPATIRALVPTIGTIRYSGLAFDVRNTESKTPERVQFGLKNLEATADKPINGIPTNVRLAVQNFAMPLASYSSQDGIKEIVALGYNTVDMSWALAANWNEAAKEVALSEVSLQGADMGRLSLKGVIAGVSRDVFDPDTTTATISLLGATARSVDLTVENTGLFERVLAAEAKKQKKTVDALRREYGAAAAVAIPMILGNTEQAKTLGQAVAKFVAKPGRLRITAKAKDPAGLGVADVLSAPEPAAVLRKLDVTAVAEKI